MARPSARVGKRESVLRAPSQPTDGCGRRSAGGTRAGEYTSCRCHLARQMPCSGTGTAAVLHAGGVRNDADGEEVFDAPAARAHWH